MNIAFFETDAYEQEYLEKKLKKHNLKFHPRPFEETDIKHLYQTEILVVFIYSHITRHVIQNMPCLKLIVTMSTGYDHIDLEYCRHTGIIVCNVPKYGGACVAEHTFALILALARKLPKAIIRTEHDDFSIDGLMGATLEGKTLGIIGFGTIGSRVARIARGFNMRVLTTTEHKKHGHSESIAFVPLKTLLKEADIVTLHTPLTKNTHHFINASTFRLMKRGAFLINTARGELVDTHALVKALDAKKLAGFACDVLEGECEIKEAHQPRKKAHHEACDWRLLRQTHALLKRNNVLVTPHIAFYTREALETIMKTTANNIGVFIKGTPINVVG